MKKKVLIVLPNDSLGGAEQYLKMIATYYKAEEVSIYFFKNDNKKQWDDLKNSSSQKFISSKHEFFGLLGFVLLMIQSKTSYEYVFSSHIFTNSIVGLLRRFRIIKTKYFVARESTSIFLRFKGIKLLIYKFWYKIGYYKIDLLICQTELMKNQLVKHFSSLSKRTQIVVIPNPINLELIKDKASETLNTKLDVDYIVSAGRLIHIKGYDILIKAFSEIKKQHHNLKLIILGSGSQKEQLKELITTLNLTNDVILPGHVSNVYKYFKNAKLCVVSSRLEGFPNVLLQMMSQNNNVVSTLCAGGIENIKGVFTCKTDNTETLKNTINLCLKGTTKDNRQLFDTFLKSRNIDSFINTINTHLLKTQ
jgi:glycosyltransferase involved in cell wall biosynthesis